MDPISPIKVTLWLDDSDAPRTEELPLAQRLEAGVLEIVQGSGMRLVALDVEHVDFPYSAFRLIPDEA